MNTKLIKAIVGSTSFKLLSAIVTFITVPLLLHSLGTENYAIWVTSTALVAWLNLFDFGAGYSLKNKVTESIALGNIKELNILIAGTLQFYFLMTLGILIAFSIALVFVRVFVDNKLLVLILYLPIIISFPLTLGHFIIQGRKMFNRFNFILLFQSISWLAVALFFRFSNVLTNVYLLASLYSLLFFITNLAIMLVSLNGLGFDLKELSNFKNFSDSKRYLKVGTRFFLLQLSSIFLFSLGNILTYNNLSLKNVTEYDTVNKIYLMGTTLFSVVVTVFWTEISHAKAIKDKYLLLKLNTQLLTIAGVFSVGTCVFTFLVPAIIRMWTQDLVNVEILELAPFSILICCQAFAYSGAVILNAFEELKGQIILSILSSILIIPLSKLLFRLDLGIGSVPLASSILILPTVIFVVITSRKMIKSM